MKDEANMYISKIDYFQLYQNSIRVTFNKVISCKRQNRK